ncbi:MAG: hypothetical protein JWN98_224, partial [Abditibacteriota bacterium]|nr:hypothetical protein [Abditibacteriota bacterium]
SGAAQKRWRDNTYKGKALNKVGVGGQNSLQVSVREHTLYRDEAHLDMGNTLAPAFLSAGVDRCVRFVMASVGLGVRDASRTGGGFASGGFMLLQRHGGWRYALVPAACDALLPTDSSSRSDATNDTGGGLDAQSTFRGRAPGAKRSLVSPARLCPCHTTDHAFSSRLLRTQSFLARLSWPAPGCRTRSSCLTRDPIIFYCFKL